MLARSRGGLLTVGSGAGLAPMPFDAAYSGSKHLVHGWLESLRIELRGTCVRVTEVCPGPRSPCAPALRAAVRDERPGAVCFSAPAARASPP